MAVQARITATNLSFSALRSVFRPGQTVNTNIRASEYFRNGGTVSSMATNGGIADAGQSNLSMAGFVGARGSAWQYRETLTKAAGWGTFGGIIFGYEYTNTDSTWIFDSIDRNNTATNYFMKTSPNAATTCSTYDIGAGTIRTGARDFITVSNSGFIWQTGESTNPLFEPNWGRPFTGAYFTNTTVITLLNRYVIWHTGLPTNDSYIQDVILTFPNTLSLAAVRAYRWNNTNYFIIAGLTTSASGATRIWWKPADNYASASWTSFDIFTGLSLGSFTFTVQGEWAVLHGTNGWVYASNRAVSGNSWWYEATLARTAMGSFYINTCAYSEDSQVWIMAGQSGRMIRGQGADPVAATWTEVGSSLRNNTQWQSAAFNGNYIDTVTAWGSGFIALGSYSGASAWSPDGITWYFGTGAEGQTVRSTLNGKTFQAAFYDSVLDRLYFWYNGGYYLRTDGRDLTFTANSGTTLTRPYPANAVGGSGSAAPAIGSAYQGGYYVGRMVVDGLIYRLIVSPKLYEQQKLMKSSFSFLPEGTTSLIDGWANTQAMFNQPNSQTDYPAAYYCRTLNISGYTDWYLPSRDELELIYRNLKPTTEQNITAGGTIPLIGPATDGYPYGQNLNSLPRQINPYTVSDPAQTQVAIFTNGSQNLAPQTFWSSSRTVNEPSYAWGITLTNGSYYWGYLPNQNLWVRAVRRVLDA